MKKIMAYNTKRYFSNLTLVICLILFNFFLIFGCGLETFYYIEAPVTTKTIPDINSNNVLNQSFNFSTKVDIGTSGGLVITGTQVYYKIYNDSSVCSADKDRLLKLNNETNFDVAATLINGTDFSYKPLYIRYDNNNSLHNEFMITDDLADVSIRLTNANIDGLNSYIKINDNKLGIPVRQNGKDFNFNKNNKPFFNANEPDVKISKDSTSGEWFVCMFAVSRGRDDAWSNKFSKITYLGTVKILEDKDN